MSDEYLEGIMRKTQARRDAETRKPTTHPDQARVEGLIERLRNGDKRQCPFPNIDIDPNTPCPVCGDLGTINDAPSKCVAGNASLLHKEAADALSELLSLRASPSAGEDAQQPWWSIDPATGDTIDAGGNIVRSAAPSPSAVTREPSAETLQWNFEGRGLWRAMTPMGRYTIVDGNWWGPEPTNDFYEAANTEAAKVAVQAHHDALVRSMLAASPEPETQPVAHVSVDYDGFVGDVIGNYVTREGKRGVVVQQDGTRVVHVYNAGRVLPAPKEPTK